MKGLYEVSKPESNVDMISLTPQLLTVPLGI